MPCNSDYMRPTGEEIELAGLGRLLEEVTGRAYLNGDRGKVYARLARIGPDGLVRKLCSALKGKDARRFSLELQIWWRDHQEADRRRIKKEKSDRKIVTLRKKGLAKLTKEELDALGLKR